jgi:hypothetical protein
MLLLLKPAYLIAGCAHLQCALLQIAAYAVPEIPKLSTMMTAIACRTQKDARRAAIIDGCRRKILRFLHLEAQAFFTWRAGRACALKMRDARIEQVWRACCLNP